MLARRSVVRVFAYFSVGFVLIFFGKISKAELFYNYSRSITDVSGRNSQELSIAGKQEILQVTSPEVPSRTSGNSSASIAGIHSLLLSFIHQQPASNSGPAVENKILPSGLEIFFWSRPGMAP